MDTNTEDAASVDVASAPIPPWQEIEPGRYMPRRVRGSCHGRELG
jgi:hypothetical protein